MGGKLQPESSDFLEPSLCFVDHKGSGAAIRAPNMLMMVEYFTPSVSVLSPISRQECPLLRSEAIGSRLRLSTHHRQHIYLGNSRDNVRDIMWVK